MRQTKSSGDVHARRCVGGRLEAAVVLYRIRCLKSRFYLKKGMRVAILKEYSDRSFPSL